MDDAVDEFASLLRSAGVVFAGTVLARGLGFVGHVLIANALLPTTFGAVGLAYTVVTVVGIATMIGVPKAVPRRMSEAERDPQLVLAAAYAFAIPLGVTATVLVSLFPDAVAGVFGSPRAADILRVLSIYLLFHPVAGIAVSGLRGDERSVATTLIRDVIAGMVPLAVFLLAARLGNPFAGAVVYYLIGQFLIAALGTAMLIRRFGIPFGRLRAVQSELVDLVSFAWPLALSSNLILLMNNLDVLMIGALTSVESVGFYKSIQPLGRIALIPLTSFTFLYLPAVTRYYEDGRLDLTERMFTATAKWVSLLTAPFVVTIVLFPESLIRVLFRPEYLPAAAALSVYGLGVFSRVFVGPNGAMVEVIDRTRIDLLAALLGAATNVVLNVALIPRFGIVGAALATGVGFLVYNFAEVAYVYHVTGIHPFSLNTVKPILVMAAGGLLARQVLAPESLGFPQLAVLGAGLGTVELLALVVTRSLDDEDRLMLRRVLDRLGVDPESLPTVVSLRTDEE